MKSSHRDSANISLYFYSVMLFLQELRKSFPLNLITAKIQCYGGD